jgi:hypothetical protein
LRASSGTSRLREIGAAWRPSGPARIVVREMTYSNYTYDEAAAEVCLSRRAIEREVARHRLIPAFYGAKPTHPAHRAHLLARGAPDRAALTDLALPSIHART